MIVLVIVFALVFNPFLIVKADYCTPVTTSQLAADGEGIVIVIVGRSTVEVPGKRGETILLQLEDSSGTTLASTYVAVSSTWEYTGEVSKQGTYTLIITRTSGTVDRITI